MINNQLIGKKIANYKFWEGIVDPENPARSISRAHKQIVLWAKQEKLKSVMIAEDDVKFIARGAFDYFIKNEPEDYDLYLGGIYYGKISEDNTVSDFAGAMLYMIHEKFTKPFCLFPKIKISIGH
ncbi:MAG: hypothetical protein IPK10_09755 [Bacteroidetes bacterium]|nr:hypothetical protein [Bacteroidota bacterium]